MNTRSILPNSSPDVLRAITGKHGTLCVKWVGELDSHVLYFNASPIASHHNGYSCRALADRIHAAWEGRASTDRAIEQAEYIQRCGGMGNTDAVRHIAEGLPETA
jgi:hypothetical protein